MYCPERSLRIITKLQDARPHSLLLLERRLKDYANRLRVQPLFRTLHPEALQALNARAARPGYAPPDFTSFFSIDLQEAELAGPVLSLLQGPDCCYAYLEAAPQAPPAVCTTDGERYCPDYLKAAPAGIDALFAWEIEGGQGARIRFADVEQGWDRSGLPVEALPETGINMDFCSDHGRKVLSVLALPGNERGGSGIVPEAAGLVVSQWRPDGTFNTADAVLLALSHLRAGDVLLLEAQVPEAPCSRRLWPVEVQPPVFEVIRLATALDITVIEAAGNGDTDQCKGNCLDHFEWQGRRVLDPGHPHFRDSGAVLVAAATCQWPRTRLPFSNYGRRIDCHAWGERVNPFHNYHPGLSGTSAAAAIIAGLCVSLQGIAQAQLGYTLPPLQLRDLLRRKAWGTAPTQGSRAAIGTMPDLRRILRKGLKLPFRKRKFFTGNGNVLNPYRRA